MVRAAVLVTVKRVKGRGRGYLRRTEPKKKPIVGLESSIVVDDL